MGFQGAQRITAALARESETRLRTRSSTVRKTMHRSGGEMVSSDVQNALAAPLFCLPCGFGRISVTDLLD